MNFPSDLKYTSDHAWVECDGDIAKIGITDYAQDKLGDVLYVDLPEVGNEIQAGDVFTEVESSKTTSEVPAPVSGEIISVNEELDDSPELVNENPYDAWIIEVRLSEPSEINALLTADEYEAGLE